MGTPASDKVRHLRMPNEVQFPEQNPQVNYGTSGNGKHWLVVAVAPTAESISARTQVDVAESHPVSAHFHSMQKVIQLIL